MIRRRLLNWFEHNGRDYPWRRTGNWFHLLLAEMMLRRTRADQVLPVYEAFCREFRDAASTRRLSEQGLMRRLHPLGLHWRSKDLVRTFDYLRHHYGQHAPAPSDDLKAIPGVGPYSEAMLRNRLFGERRAAVDANVVRILLRWQGQPVVAEARRRPELWVLADAFVAHKRSADLNLALLDFGAAVCRPARPRCSECSLAQYCLQAGTTLGAGGTEARAKLPRRANPTA